MTATRARLVLAVVGGVTLTVLFDSFAPQPSYAQPGDPCATASSLSPLKSVPSAAAQADGREPQRRPLDHDDRWRHLDGLYAHRATVARGRLTQSSLTSPSLNQQSSDVGDIAVLQDAGDLMIRPNPLDLRDAGVRLTPNNRGGYDTTPLVYAFRQPLGSPITLSDDDTREIALPFAFPYFGQPYTPAFVDSDGNLTFTEGDSSSVERSVSRLLSGPP